MIPITIKDNADMYTLICFHFPISYTAGQQQCTADLARQCGEDVGEPWIKEIMKGKLSVISSLDINQACR